jgi:hypothetical protein
MLSPPRSSNIGRAREIVKVCQQELEETGFRNRKDTTLWRRTNVKFDILKFDIIPNARSQKWHVPPGSFGLAPSCLFPFLPRLGHTPDSEIPRPENGYGQVRLSIRRGIPQPLVRVPNVWWAGDSTSVFDAVTKDVLGKITTEVFAFFSRFDDTKELLRTFLEDDDAIGLHEGVWEFGKRESARRLLYIGFAAIECGKWDLAISSLRACSEETNRIPERVGEQIGERVQAEILPYVKEGLACVERQGAWLSGFGVIAR